MPSIHIKTFRKFLFESFFRKVFPGVCWIISERNFRKVSFGKFLKLERVQDFEKLSESFLLSTNDIADFCHVPYDVL